MPTEPLPFTSHQSLRCALHPGLAAPWSCAACQRGHCDACRGRVERRLTPSGTCLQCAGPLRPVAVEIDAPSLGSAVRQAYRPLGLACAAALGLPMLYGGVMPALLPHLVVVTAACAWTFFLAVVRWRMLGHSGLPTPADALENLRQAMAVISGFVASLLAVVPALVAQAAEADPVLTGVLALAGLLWLPVPVLAAAASSNFLLPFMPLRVLAAVSADPHGYLGMAARAVALTVALIACEALLVPAVGLLPGVGPWFVAIGVLPGAWAVAIVIGRWGQARVGDIDVDV